MRVTATKEPVSQDLAMADVARLGQLLAVLVAHTGDPRVLVDNTLWKLAELFVSDIVTLDMASSATADTRTIASIGLGDVAVTLHLPGVLAAAAGATTIEVANGDLPPELSELGVLHGVHVGLPGGAGVLSLYRCQAAGFSAHELQLLTVMGRHLSLVLRSAWRLSQLSALADHSLRIGACHQESEVCALAVEEVLTLLRADGAALAVIDAGTARWVEARGLSQTLADDWSCPVEELGAYPAVQQRRPFFCSDIRRLSRNGAAGEWGVCATLAVPVKIEGSVAGLLYAFRRNENGFTPDDADVLTLLAGQVAAALTNSRLILAAERRHARAESLRRLSAMLSSNLDPASVVGNVCVALLEHSTADRVSILVLNEGHDALSLLGTLGTGADEHQAHLTAALSQLAPSDARDLAALLEKGLGGQPPDPDVAAAVLALLGRPGGVDLCWVQPLTVHDEVLGLVLLEHLSGCVDGGSAAAPLATIVDMAAVALGHARLFERVERDRRQLSALHDVALSISSDDDLATTLERIRIAAQHLTGAVCAHFVLHDDGSPAADDASCGGGSALTAEMVGRGSRALGLLVLHHPSASFFASSSLDLVERFATEAALAIENRHDLDARRALEAELREKAFQDPLTGLPNRANLMARISTGLLRISRSARPGSLALLFLDLDRFKAINDTMGHAAGDEFLVAITQRLTQAVRPGDTVGRLGGDEFVVLLDRTGSEEQVAAVAQRILNAVAEPLVIGGQTLFATVSIGATMAHDASRSAGELLRDADIAMYRSKATGRARLMMFEPSMRVDDRLSLDSELRQALTDQALQVHYQPIVDLATGRVLGVEALARWPHPRLGWVPPAQFVQLAEETGLVRQLDQYVLAAALRDLGRLPHQQAHLGVSVNLSAAHLHEATLPELVGSALVGSGVHPARLTLEITETAAMQDPCATMQSLEALVELGVSIALDDFGTGYSNLGHLKRLPIHDLKLDRSFVEHLDTDEQDAAIVTAVLTLSRALGLRVTAEGVETPRQRRRLVDGGCQRGQGYLFSRAVPLPDLVALLQGGRGRLPTVAAGPTSD